MEAPPIDSWTVDPDFDANEREMMGKFRGYSNERPHFPKPDTSAIRDPAVIKKIKTAFLKVPYHFDIYFWHGPNPDYDPHLQYGLADRPWVVKHMGEQVAAEVFGKRGITIIMTNNLSDESYISLRNPWIFAHRIAHALIGGHTGPIGDLVISKFEDFVFRIAKVGYGVEWNTWNHHIYTDEREIITKLLGHHFGTMRSAREGRLVQAHEWFYETFTQYLMTGKVTFKPLPQTLDDYYRLTTQPKKLATTIRLWGRFPMAIMKLFDKTLTESAGKVFVI